MQSFELFELKPELLRALSDLGYETPSPVQAQGIPILLEGRDIIALAQTGTGKTATFALPILSKLDLSAVHPQALIITPTRELAIQVAEAFQSYAKHIPDLHVLPIYGGQEYRNQLKALSRGVHVVVGTPGRIMDHLRRGTLKLNHLKMIVLDEADEMLKMGFIDDVEWILTHIPGEHQTALFSATMPPAIQKIATKYTNNPASVNIQPHVKTVELIDQYYMLIDNHNKLEALTRFLEVEAFDAILIFARTKTATAELAQKLEARGYAVAALNGDMNQAAREKVIQRLKQESIDIVVATEIAARGLDVSRINLVINYDIPQDPEAYVHRIGRTGRAGRAGKSLTLVTPRENRMLKTIENAIRKKIVATTPPTTQQINQKRIADFNQSILTTIAEKNLDQCRTLIETLVHDAECSALDIAAALAFLAQKKKSLSMKEDKDLSVKPHKEFSERRGERPFKKREGRWSNEDSFKRSRNKPFRKRSDDSFKHSDEHFEHSEERSFKRSSERPFARKEKPFKKSRERSFDKEERPFKRSSERSFSREERPFKRSSERTFSREEKPFKKSRERSFDKEEKPFKRSSERSFSREEKPFRKSRERSFDREERPSKRSSERAFAKKERKSFGKPPKRSFKKSENKHRREDF